MSSRSFGVLAAVGFALLLPATAVADRSFTPRFSANDTGDIVMVSNTLMTCPTSASNCTRARNADPTLPDSQLQNNSYAMTYVDVDGNAGVGASTFNSSTSQLNLPAGATVLFAGLYWGRRHDRQRLERAAERRPAKPGRVPRPGRRGLHDADRDHPGRLDPGRPLPGLPRRHVARRRRGQRHLHGRQRPGGRGDRPLRGLVARDRLPRPGRAGAEPHRLRRSAHGQRHHRSDDSGQRLPHAALGTGADEGRRRSPTRAISGSPATARTSTERRSRTPRTRRTTSSTPRSRIPERGSARRTRTTRTSSATTPTSSTPTASSPTTRPRRTSA